MSKPELKPKQETVTCLPVLKHGTCATS